MSGSTEFLSEKLAFAAEVVRYFHGDAEGEIEDQEKTCLLAHAPCTVTPRNNWQMSLMNIKGTVI